MTTDNNQITCTAKHDAFRSSTDFSDLLKIVASYYEMYSKCVTFLGPWIAKQQGMVFIPPDKEDLKLALGKERPLISYMARASFIDSVVNYISKTRGKRTLITPNPSSHHSAQFPYGSFNISQVTKEIPNLKDDRAPRKKCNLIHRIDFFGSPIPVFIENLKIPVDQIQFIILRPKLGKLATPSTSRWEVLLFKNNPGYLVDHVDSHINPRWAGMY